MATFMRFDLDYLDLPPPETSGSVVHPAFDLDYLDMPPNPPACMVRESINLSFEGAPGGGTWYYMNTAYDTVAGEWIEWRSWQDPDPEGLLYPGPGVPADWEADSYSFYVIQIEGL